MYMAHSSQLLIIPCSPPPLISTVELCNTADLNMSKLSNSITRYIVLGTLCKIDFVPVPHVPVDASCHMRPGGWWTRTPQGVLMSLPEEQGQKWLRDKCHSILEGHGISVTKPHQVADKITYKAKVNGVPVTVNGHSDAKISSTSPMTKQVRDETKTCMMFVVSTNSPSSESALPHCFIPPSSPWL